MKELAEGETTAEDMAKQVMKDQSLLPEIFDGVSSENPRVKFKSAKILSLVSQKKPAILYSRIDFFINLLNSENNILKWIAIDVIGNLTVVDSEDKFERIFRKYYGYLLDDSMITVGHVVDNSGKIAQAKPHLTQKIVNELLKIEKIPLKPHLTQECKNILLGKTIVALSMFFDQVENKEDVVSFVKRHLSNPRNATKAKAEKFLKKLA